MSIFANMIDAAALLELAHWRGVVLFEDLHELPHPFLELRDAEGARRLAPHDGVAVAQLLEQLLAGFGHHAGTLAEGHRSATGQISHRGLRATHTARP